MEKEYRYISYCGKYYCAFCDYYKGTIVNAARNLLTFAEKYGSSKLIVDASNVCNFEEFIKGLGWLASQKETLQRLPFWRRMVVVGRLSSS